MAGKKEPEIVLLAKAIQSSAFVSSYVACLVTNRCVSRHTAADAVSTHQSCIVNFDRDSKYFAQAVQSAPQEVKVSQEARDLATSITGLWEEVEATSLGVVFAIVQQGKTVNSDFETAKGEITKAVSAARRATLKLAGMIVRECRAK